QPSLDFVFANLAQPRRHNHEGYIIRRRILQRGGSERRGSTQVQVLRGSGAGLERPFQNPAHARGLKGRGAVIPCPGLEGLKPFRDLGPLAYHNQADTRLPLFEGLQQASVLRRLGSAKHDFSVKLVDQLQQQGRSRERARINGVPFIREDSLQLRNQIVGKTQQDNARNPLTFREHTPSARQDFRWPGEARLAGTRSSLRVAMSRYSLIAYGVLPGSPIRNAYARYIFLVMLRMTWPEKGFEERLNIEKCQVRLSARFAKKRQGQFARVVITPHRRLAAGDSPAGRNKVPTPRAM